MDRYVVLGVGSDSDLKHFDRRYSSLEGRTVFEFLEERGIRQLGDPLKVSCHRTLDRATGYARDLQEFAENNPVVAVFFGGLSLALPGIVASQTTTIPIIGVPAYSKGTHGAGLDSTTAVYNLPPGTVVGGAPLHFPEGMGMDGWAGLDSAVIVAERMLKERYRPLTVVGPSGSKQLDSVKGFLNPPEGRPYDPKKGVLGVEYTHQATRGKEENLDLVLNIAVWNSEFGATDKQSRIALQTRMPSSHEMEGIESLRAEWSDYCDTVIQLCQTHNTLYFARPENAALFAARVKAVHDPDLRARLVEYNEQKKGKIQEKYGEWVKLNRHLFV